MATNISFITVLCIDCARPFEMTLPAYTHRTARAGSAIRCPHCQADLWLRQQGREQKAVPRAGEQQDVHDR